MNSRDLRAQPGYWLPGDASGQDAAGDVRYFEPVLTKGFDQPPVAPPADSDPPSMQIQFKPGDLAKEPPAAVLLAQIADENFEFTRATPGPEQAAMRGRVEGIKQQFAEQARLAGRLEHELGSAPDEADNHKTVTPSLSNQVSELLRCQEYIEMAELFEESAEQDERQAMKLTSLLQKLNDWYVDGIGEIRDELRTKRNAPQWVRQLLRCSSEMLIDLGIRLAREPSIRAAVQDDLVRIYEDFVISPDIRHRAWAYLFLDVRAHAPKRSSRKG